MTVQEVKFSNFYESTLASGGLPQNVTTCTLTAAPTTDGSSAIGANYYLVVDPDTAGSREVIEVTAATGTSLTTVTRDVEGRYGTPGDASTAPNHNEGTVVRMAVVRQMFEDVHDRIEDVALTGDVTGTINSSTQDIATTISAGAVDFAMIADTIDEDNMVSDSETKLPTQQSVKAYVDTQISGHDSEHSDITLDTFAAPTGAIDINDQELGKAVLKDYAETDVALSSSSGVVAIDLANGNTGSLTLTENVTDIDFTNVPANGVSTFTLKITQDAASAYTVAINAITVNGGGDVTAKTTGADGFNMTATLSAEDLLFFMFFDAGTPYLTAQQEMS